MMKLRTFAVCTVALAATAPTLSARQHAPSSGIVGFGTSLSDSGNAFALRGGTNTPPDYNLNPLLIPNAPYARGGHHFSNGATWVEQFPRALGLAGTVRPAYGSDSPLATNFAVGAARACDAPGQPRACRLRRGRTYKGDDMTTVVAALALMTTLSSGPSAPGRSLVAGQENPPAAQTAGPTDADAIRQGVQEGQKVRVTDDQGREWQGRIEALAPDSLVLLTKDHQRRDLPYAAIIRIDRPHDTLGNGALIGFVSGAVYGLFAVVAEENADCEPGAFFSCGDPTGAAYVVIPPVLGAIGAGIGVAIDALVRRDPTLFRRGDSRVMLAPLLGRDARGLRLSVRW